MSFVYYARFPCPCLGKARTLHRMVDHLLVTTTTPDRESAARLAESAVRAKLSASAQVHGPVASFFWHLGEQGEGEEWIATFKTTSARYPALEAHLVAEHPWQNPEVTAIPLVRGTEGYLRWLEASTGAESQMPISSSADPTSETFR